MKKQIAITGAGYAGLAAARAVIENDMQPTIFEAAGEPGGLWRSRGGFTWDGMRTNISKWNQGFSDFPFSDNTPDFPTTRDVRGYLKRYAEVFKLDKTTHFDTRVTSLTPKHGHWDVEIAQNTRKYRMRFDGCIAASGIFAKPAFPNDVSLPQSAIHSADYRRSPDWNGKRVAVIAGSFTGIEIAADLAAQGAAVLLFMPRPLWILPRQVDGVPLDLVSNKRRSAIADPTEANLAKAKYIEGKYGNPGEVHPDLRVPVDKAPVYVAIADTFLDHVRRGAITPIIGRVARGEEGSIITANDKTYAVDQIVACTGYNADLSYFPRPVQRLLGYDSDDKLMPFLAELAVRPADLPGLYFVGAYRGPYPGIIELQARLAAAELANNTPPATRGDLAGVKAIRAQSPRPQFPFGNYVAFADELAQRLGVMPDLDDPLIAAAPVTPAQYRLRGPHALPMLARAGVRSATARAGL